MPATTLNVHRLQRATTVVALIAAAAACYLLLFDAGASWVDWTLGGAMGVLTLHGISELARGDEEQLVPTWRARNVWEIVSPFLIPVFLVGWADDRGSRLAWLGWLLLVAAIVVQVALWQIERPRTDPTRGGRSPSRPDSPPSER